MRHFTYCYHAIYLDSGMHLTVRAHFSLDQPPSTCSAVIEVNGSILGSVSLQDALRYHLSLAFLTGPARAININLVRLRSSFLNIYGWEKTMPTLPPTFSNLKVLLPCASSPFSLHVPGGHTEIQDCWSHEGHSSSPVQGI